ncbi:AraC family transcriptional regulator [Paenibacillus humicola]|uniref:AraC family transcriptional regulator n=1 Tax=Paenibacillus humicola TaxID=3110540 RepID=UPI00237B002E|nr:AraC family transcriptional regulator [Paenibacillus humicola]
MQKAPWPVVHSMGDIWIKPGSVLGTRTIDDYELVYFPSGTGTIYDLEGKEYALTDPCFVMTRPGERHSYRFDPERSVRHLFIHYDGSAYLGTGGTPVGQLRQPVVVPAGSHQLAAGLIKRMLWVGSMRPAGWIRRLSVLLAGALEELCAAPADASAGEPDSHGALPLPLPITKALRYMEEHLEKRLSIETIALQSGWSHEHFTRMFVQYVGISPKQALLERRLQRAEQLLMSGEWTVKQIAHQVGFTDEHHFSKMYKRLRGITATVYKQRCAEPIFRHMAPAAADPDTPYPVNRHIVVSDADIK